MARTQPVVSPQSGGRLAGRVALVTGASSGVGRATARLFAGEGALVLSTARRGALLAEATEDLTGLGLTADYVVADVSRDDGARSAVDHAIRAHGRIDIVVNAAGIGHSFGVQNPGAMESITRTNPAQWQTVLDSDLNSIFYVCRHAIPHMERQRRGAVVNIASISGSFGLPVAHAYTAAKGAVINLTKSLAVAYAQMGIRANCVAPGYVDTPMIAHLMSVFENPETAFEASPMGRPATPTEIAYACLFLASDEASYCNGAVLTVDGGTSAHQRSGPVLH